MRINEIDLGINKPGSYVSFYWFRGTNRKGERHIFRFMKGGNRAEFDKYVKSHNLSNIEGPFKTMKGANT